jgi:tRNA (guanosine-2'-O-)-methyltransferase
MPRKGPVRSIDTITGQRLERIRGVLSRRQPDLTLALCNIHDPHNVSAILRSCDAFGVMQVHLYYSTDAFPVLGTRSSASAKKWVARKRYKDPKLMIGSFREAGYQVVGTGFGPGARPVTEWDFTRPTAIVLGNEHRGIDEEVAALVPDLLYVPMQGMIQSLNVSVAAAIILYEAWRQRMGKGMYDEPGMPQAELEEMVREWAGK